MNDLTPTQKKVIRYLHNGRSLIRHYNQNFYLLNRTMYSPSFVESLISKGYAYEEYNNKKNSYIVRYYGINEHGEIDTSTFK